MTNIIKINNTKELHDIIASKKDMLLMYSVEWCGECKMIKVLLDELHAEFPQVLFYEIDVDRNKLWAEEIDKSLNLKGIDSVPTIACYRDGKEILFQPEFKSMSYWKSVLAEKYERK